MRARENTRLQCDRNHVLKQGVDLALALRHFGHSGCVESSELVKCQCQQVSNLPQTLGRETEQILPNQCIQVIYFIQIDAFCQVT